MRETTDTGRAAPSVLFITRAYPPIRGGMERFSYDLTTAVATRTRAHIIANRYGKAFLPIFVVIAFLRAFSRARRYDVVHVGDPVLAPLAWLLKRLRGRPTCMTVHGLDILYPSRAYQWMLRRFLPAADLLICISASVAARVRERFGITRTIVIPPGITDTLYRPGITKAMLAPVLGITPGTRPILLTVGRLVRRKGVAWFVRHVLPRLPADTLYVVAGRGPERQRILAAAKRAGAADRVILTGTVPPDHLRVLYNAADVFVMPNIFVPNDAEGFGLVALEAASCELPVVASALEGIVDAVFDGRNGILVSAEHPTEFARAITRLLEDAAERADLGARARAFTLQHFQWNTIVKKYLETYENLRRL